MWLVGVSFPSLGKISGPIPAKVSGMLVRHEVSSKLPGRLQQKIGEEGSPQKIWEASRRFWIRLHVEKISNDLAVI